MELDAKTQAFVDGLISKKYAEAHAKAEAKAAEQLAAAEAKHAEETNTLKAEIEKLKGNEGGWKERVRKALLKAEISQTSAIKVDQVMKLINEGVVIGDGGELAVVDSEGNVRLDEAGKPYSVKGFVEGFLMDNPHLAKSAALVGSGSRSAIGLIGEGGRAMRRGDFDKMDPAQKTNFLHSGGRLIE